MSPSVVIVRSVKRRVATVEVTSEFRWLQSAGGRPGPEAKSHFCSDITGNHFPLKTILVNPERIYDLWNILKLSSRQKHQMLSNLLVSGLVKSS